MCVLIGDSVPLPQIWILIGFFEFFHVFPWSNQQCSGLPKLSPRFGEACRSAGEALSVLELIYVMCLLYPWFSNVFISMVSSHVCFQERYSHIYRNETILDCFVIPKKK